VDRRVDLAASQRIPVIFTTYEDRPACLVGVKILVKSLARHLPEARIRIWCPVDEPAFADFFAWLETQ